MNIKELDYRLDDVSQDFQRLLVDIQKTKIDVNRTEHLEKALDHFRKALKAAYDSFGIEGLPLNKRNRG